jgi:hypothetical protein
MELIPVLSTIILAATASTFLLAVGAYILYKIRERRIKKNIITPPLKYDAELLSPELSDRDKIPGELKLQPQDAIKTMQNLNSFSLKEDEENKTEKNIPWEPEEIKKTKSKFLKYTSDGYISPKDDKKPGSIRWR